MQFLKVPYVLITDKNINANEYRVYTFLMSLYSEKKKCAYPSIQTIAESINLSSRTVKKCISNLVKLKYMNIEKRKCVKGNYNTYKNLRYLISNTKKKESGDNVKNKNNNPLSIEEELVISTKKSVEEVREAISYAIKKGASNIKAYAKSVIENKWNKKDAIKTEFANFTQRQYDYEELEESLVYAHMSYSKYKEKGRITLDRYKNL